MNSFLTLNFKRVAEDASICDDDTEDALQEGGKAEEAGPEAEVGPGVSVSIAMETKKEKERRSSESETYEYERVTWAPNPILALSGIPESIKNSSLQSSHAYSESFRYGFATRPRRGWSLALPPHPEPQLLRLRPSSLCTQDISHLLTSVFRNLYSAEVIGEEVSASLIKARGSDDARHEEFVDQLQQIRELHKQRLDEVKMLERHIIQAQARALAETERSMNQAGVHVLEALKLPPVKTVFRWCVDSELLRKHHLISPEDYYNDTLPFCSAPKGTSIAECSKLRFRCEKNFTPKGAQGKKLAVPFREKLAAFGDEFDYTMDSLEGDSIPKGKQRTKDTVKKARPPKNKNWMKHLHVPQRELERLLLARMESRNHFLRNPRFFPPNTPHGGKSLIFPPVKPALMGDPPSPELEQSYMDAPVFLAKPSIGFFTDYEIGPVYEVLFLPVSLEKAEQTFIIVCDNCQVKELVITGTGQLIALDLIYISGEKSQPDPGELTDLTAQHFIRFKPENLRSTARKQLIIRNATHVELAFHWQIMKPNLQPLMPGETYSLDSINYHPDRETAFSIMPEKGVLSPHTDQEFVLSFSPSKLRSFHSVLQMVLEEVPEPLNSEVRNLEDYMYSVDDVIVLEIEVKGSAEPFQVLLEPYALIIPGENYIGINVKKDFKMWNNSKSPISYTWGKISHCHIIEVEPCTGVIEPNEVGDFVLNFTGGVPGPASQDLLCEIRDSPSPVVLHIEAAFKGPALVISVSALQFGLLRLGQKVTNCIQIRNVSQLSAVWHMRESPICLEERREEASPFDIEPSSGYLHPLGECQVMVTLEALRCQRLQTVLELEVEKGTWSYLPVYAEVQEPHVYLQSSQVEFSNLYVGVPTESTITLINGTLLFTRFHWGKLLGHQADSCTATVSPKRGLLGPGEECELNLELTTHTKEELTDLALPCHVSGMKKPLALGISGKPQGLHVTITVSVKGSDISTKRWPGDLEELHLDFGSMVPLRTQVNGQLILTNCSPVQTSFTLNFEYFGSPKNSLTTNTSLPDLPPALLKTSRIREHLAKQEQLDFMESMLSPGKGAAFFPHTSKGTLGAYQKLSINITGCANMWGEYWDNLICQVGDLPPAVIPVHMAVVGCPISTRQATSYRADKFQKEPIIRFGTQVSGGATIMRKLRLNNSSPCDIRLDWVTYVPEEKEDKLVDLLVFYGPPFPLWDQAGNEITYPETPESSSLPWSPSPSSVSDSSHAATSLVEAHSSASNRAAEQIISVILQGHEGVPSNLPYYVSPKQVVVPAGGSSTICISFTPMVLSPHIQQKVKCTGYALGFMSLDNEEEREIPGRLRRLQDFAVGPLRLDLHGHVRRAQLSVELDSSGNVEFWCQASDLIPEQPCSGVLSELLTTRHLKLINTTEIPHYFQLLVSRPFFVSQGQASRGHRAGSGQEQEYGETASEVMPLELRPQENMLVDVSFSLSLELLSYQRLPLDQMLPGVDIQQSTSGEKEMVFTQDLLLVFTNQTTQVVPLRATVAVPELQLSSSWVDFGTCFVNQQAAREIYLMNLSGCRSYWAVLMGQQSATEEAKEFGVSPSSGFLEARPTNAPPTSITLQVFFTPRSNELYESTMVVEGMMGEKSCALRLRGQGSYDETFMEPKQL
ncbi:deleted in lung and esophageal cancer protein 1 isoform X3 [Sciurus carolinensis]|uniref:deleted in lung and esophageal cancer protein 1 isoform X3 n=1 Tax=Sciurus carolinensis TaxID=30640 RepID=UPI001FB21168|nr:deleted in lung and esophageal cancer protein 1 isoform X3 [Sciurus carolinensis]